MIPYAHHSIDEHDIEAVIAVLRGDLITQGPAVERFEAAVCAKVGARHAVAFSSGTAALHGAAAAADLGPGDRVVTSPLSFVASANCARYVGATPVFVDIDPATLNIKPDAVPACDALVAVHYAGLPVDLSRLPTTPRMIIEDAAHALGASTPDGPVGGCARSDMCAFSFHPAKAATSGEGGAVTTNSNELAERLRRFRVHGTVHTPRRGGWVYDVASLGYNYRLSDIHAALGESQLKKLERFIARRNELADRYRERLAALPVELPPVAPPGVVHAYHLFTVRVPYRRSVYDTMRAAGVGVQVHYVPLYRHSLFRYPDQTPDRFPATERAYAGLLSLPLYPSLDEKDQDRVIAELAHAIRATDPDA